MIHGHKKSQTKKSQEQLKQQTELSEKISTKLAEFFAIRNQPIPEQKIPTLLQFTTILMQLCPDITTVFNYRRELVLKIIGEMDPMQKAKTLAGDIKLITKIMQSDPKSYTLWSYRQWLVVQLFQIDPSIIPKERELCSMLLMKDEKNFHVWNYRNWTNKIQMHLDTELQFTKGKINANPFNFSAYHFRTKYLKWKYEGEFGTMDEAAKRECVLYGMPKEVFLGEMETVRTAIFLNPKEEAPWLYYSWLLKQLLPTILLEITLSPSTQTEFYTITFSQKVSNPSPAFPQLILFSQTTPSNSWTLTLKQPTPLTQHLQKQKWNEIIIENQSAGRKLVWKDQGEVKEIAAIYEAEEKFVREVNESEDNECRFGWLQLLEIYRSMLYLGTSAQQWQEITEKGLQVFEHLKNQNKGQKYILMQHKEWQRLNDQNRLSEVEKKLREFRG